MSTQDSMAPAEQNVGAGLGGQIRQSKRLELPLFSFEDSDQSTSELGKDGQKVFRVAGSLDSRPSSMFLLFSGGASRRRRTARDVNQLTPYEVSWVVDTDSFEMLSWQLRRSKVPDFGGSADVTPKHP